MQTNSRPLETYYSAHFIYPSCWQFWGEIQASGGHWPPHQGNKKNELTKDWDGDLYCSIRLKWDYYKLTLDISLSGYILKQLQKYKINCLKCPQHCPYSPLPKQFRSDAQHPLPPDTSPPLLKKDIKHLQCIIGSIHYYAQAVDRTVLMALSTIASKQSKGTIQNTMLKPTQLMDYLATHPDATVRFHASDMILNVHSDASYLSKANAHSRACGHFFMGWKADPTKPLKLKGHFSHFPLPQLQTSNNMLTHSRGDGTSTTPHARTLQ